MKMLFSWIGHEDLRCCDQEADRGPVLELLKEGDFEHMVLLCSYPAQRANRFLVTAKEICPRVHFELALRPDLSDPTDWEALARIARQVVDDHVKKHPKSRVFFYTPSGTRAMTVIWFLLSQTLFPKAVLLQRSREKGTRHIKSPISITGHLLSEVMSQPDRVQERFAAGLPGEDEGFADIIAQSAVMHQQIERAKLLARRSVPVLITGPSGSGKELFAKAIHRAGPRRDEELIVVNCGAIPENLIESELFGVKRGAFTGAVQDRPGYFKAAHNSTLFLDELGELPLPAQVKLLRAVQQGEITPLGANKAEQVNVRLIAATNRDLPAEIQTGRFREDLFYRLAVGVLQLPPLSERPEDLPLLIQRLLEKINTSSADEPGQWPKTLTREAHDQLLKQAWPGNVRQLENSLWRAAIWSTGSQIDAQTVAAALDVLRPKQQTALLHRPFPIDLNGLVGELSRHYLERVDQLATTKTKAAELLGLNSYQALDQQRKKYLGN